MISPFENLTFFLSAPTSSSSTSSETASSTASAASLLGRLFVRRNRHLDDSSSWPQLESGIFPNVTLGRTLLNASELVQLPGNNSQVLAWTRGDENSNVTILNQMYVFYPPLLSTPNFFFTPTNMLLRFHPVVSYPNADLSKVLILTLVKILLLSTLRNGVPYSSTKSTAC